MTLTQAREQLMTLQSNMSAYQHALSMLSYDGATYAPKGTGPNRARTMSFLTQERYKLTTSPATVELLDFLDDSRKELTEREQRMVDLLLKDIRKMQRIPMEEYVAQRKLLVESGDVWHRAKETSDFAMFEPVLEKVFETNLRFAKYCAPDKDPYDYDLSEYEDGLNKETCEQFFGTLRSHIVPLLQQVQTKPQVDDTCILGNFPAQKQEELAWYLMKLMGLDLNHCTLATTEHPFTSMLGSHNDVRITTNYKDYSFSPSMFSVIHEGGHALFGSNAAPELAYTVLDRCGNMGLHESQSRFYENLLGRSRTFIHYIFPKLKEIYPSLEAYTAEDVYRAVNRAQPSLIRIEADEVTYSLHVMVRYELEKRVLAGDLKVHDLPGEWNRMYKEYLGVDVPDDRRGVLQDSHWSNGQIGYFPSYALGSAYGAQLMRTMRKHVDVDKCLSEGDFATINAWNRELIWQHGNTYPPLVVLERVTGEKFDPMAYVEYLEGKCKDIYGL